MNALRARRAQQVTDLHQLRQELEMYAATLEKDPAVRRENIDANVPAAWFWTENSVADRVVLYFHGGAYCLGSRDTHAGIAGRIAKAARARCFMPNYRLAPENPHPAAVEDATGAYRWLLEQGYRPGNIVVAGDSAGGGLTLATLVSLRDRGEPLPAAAACISPWADLEGTGDSMETNADADPIITMDDVERYATWFIGDGDRRDPLAAPLHADLHGLPPVLIQVGGNEALLDDARRVADKLENAGGRGELEVWDDMFHVWHFFAPILDEATEALERIGAFVREQTTP